MTYATLCTGIGGFDLGFDRAGMECVYQCELDKQCNRILNRWWPNVARGKDVTDDATASELIRLRPRLVAFGSPCQDLSVAGRRAGLAGERSGLFFRCVELAFTCEADRVVWENVPGVFTSNGGEDFACVLEALTGHSVGVPPNGWRNTGVCIGPLYSVAWAVLDAQWFGLAQRRERVFLVGSLSDRAYPYEVLSLAESVPWDSPPSRKSRERVADCLTAGVAASRGVNKPGRRREDDSNIVAHTLRAAGHDASEDGTGRGVPLVPVPFDTTQITSKGNYSNPQPGQPCHPLSATAHAPAIAFDWMAGDGGSDDSFRGKSRKWIERAGEYTGALGATKRDGICHANIVRRLMPIECERLMGFPDGWTAQGADGESVSDSARYHMLGNSIAVTNAEWLGRRLMEHP